MGSQKKDPELLEIPGTEGVGGESNIAVQQMIDLMNTQLEGQDIPLQKISQDIPLQKISQDIPLQKISQDIPLQLIAGLGANERTVQNLLGKFLGTSATEGEAYQLGMGELKKTLGGEFYDPRTSDFWKGYRDVSKIEQEEGVADIRRRGQLGGGLFSTGVAREEIKYQAGKEAERTLMLGGLFEKERDRKSNAVAQSLGYAGFEEAGKANRLTLGSTIGAIPRGIEDRRMGAKYTQQLGRMGALNLQNQAGYNQQIGRMGALNLQNQAGYNQQIGRMDALNLQNQANFAQALGQEQSDFATQLAEIGIQSGATQGLMPQWNIDSGSGESPLGGILGLLGAVIGK